MRSLGKSLLHIGGAIELSYKLIRREQFQHFDVESFEDFAIRFSVVSRILHEFLEFLNILIIALFFHIHFLYAMPLVCRMTVCQKMLGIRLSCA